MKRTRHSVNIISKRDSLCSQLMSKNGFGMLGPTSASFICTEVGMSRRCSSPAPIKDKMTGLNEAHHRLLLAVSLLVTDLVKTGGSILWQLPFETGRWPSAVCRGYTTSGNDGNSQQLQTPPPPHGLHWPLLWPYFRRVVMSRTPCGVWS